MRTTLKIAFVFACIGAVTPALAAEGAATGNGTSTAAGPAGTTDNGGKMDPSMTSGEAKSGAMTKSDTGANSKGESNATSTPAGPANK